MPKKQKNKTIEKGEYLSAELLQIGVGEKLVVPYKLFSLNTIKSTVAQINHNAKLDCRFSTNGKSNIAAVITRTE